MASVTLRAIEKFFGSVKVIHGVDIDIGDGEFVVLVGPSGCGKSTLLRMIAGLEEISAGQISIGDRVVNNVTPRDRDVAMVFQNYALYPHKTVYDNMAFGLKLRKADRKLIAERVKRAADILGLGELLGRYPRQLSGGQRQRVAMGRAIVRDPQLFLFDEPLSNLDAKLRVQMRTEIRSLHQKLKTTSVYVTHDQVEAMTMADRIVVLQDGRVAQIGAPIELYDRPANLFVAGFIGSPTMNVLTGTLKRSNGTAWVETDSKLRLPLAISRRRCRGPEDRLRRTAGAFRPVGGGGRAGRQCRGGRADRHRRSRVRALQRRPALLPLPRAPRLHSRPADKADAAAERGAPVRRAERAADQGGVTIPDSRFPDVGARTPGRDGTPARTQA